MKVQANFREEGRNSGTLYIVATPIGNLEDMTFRAIRVLKEAEWIAAEDTRQTRKLLNHFEISGRVVSYHEHNKRASGEELIRLLQNGESVALVSDAGLPGISDPGEDLVRLAVQEGIPVVPVPGANAALTALVGSGLSTAQFCFVGFLPRERKKQERELEKWARVDATLLFYESPHRLEKTLEALLQALGNRRIILARELTKRYEEFARGTIAESLELLKEREPKGEYCLVVEGCGDEAAGGRDPGADWWRTLSVEAHVAHYEAQGASRKDAMKRTAADRGVAKRDIYQTLIGQMED